MKVYHGTSKQNANNITNHGIIMHEDSMNIDNQGYSTFINAFFVTPNKDISHIYECDNSKNGSVIIEFEMSEDSNILDLTNKENQQLVIDYINNDKTINEYLIDNNYDGCKQIHKNDFGLSRLEYAIICIDKLNVLNMKKTKFMELYEEATQEINLQDYL
jgi:6-phosphogluconolactonase (cycloisomerase 2 family)